MTQWGPGNLLDGGGFVTVHTSTEFVIGVASGTYHAYGTGLTYYINLLTGTITFTGGTVTSVEISAFNGDQRYKIAGFSMPVASFFDALDGDTQHFLDSFLAGNDSINGSALNDTLFGYLGNDSLLGGSGDDRLSSDAGNNVLDGGTGNDTAAFPNATQGINVDLTLPGNVTVNTGIGTDTLVSIESVEGTNFADTFTAGAGTHI